jgi:hypothetical protein
MALHRATAYESVAHQLRMENALASRRRATASSRIGCPHDQQGLVAFNTLLGQGSPQNLVLPAGSKVLVDVSAEVLELTIPLDAELIFADSENLELKASNIVVEGKLSMGAEACPLLSSGIALTLTGDADAGTKGLIAMPGGTLEMHGKAFAPTWTRLAESAGPGSTQLTLMDAVDWEVGQQVVVVTTAWHDDPEDHQNEVRLITSIDASGTVITLDAALSFGHYGGQEYAAEVALLSRTITLQGDESSESTRYGGHTMCTAGSTCHISGVRAFRM